VAQRQNRKHHLRTNKRDTRHLAGGCNGDDGHIPAAVYVILRAHTHTHTHTHTHAPTHTHTNIRIIKVPHINICMNQIIRPIRVTCGTINHAKSDLINITLNELQYDGPSGLPDIDLTNNNQSLLKLRPTAAFQTLHRGLRS